jgi:capsular polysaccharide biosynthesis protein
MNQNSPGQLGQQEQIEESEISLLDILVFLRRSYKLIALVGILGIATSFGYLLITPKQYQAIAQIQMAQISSSSNNINPQGINIEEPTLLIARLSSPTSYTAEVVKSCGLGTAKDAEVMLSKSVRLTVPKGIANTVDLRVIDVSPKASLDCAQAVFNLIKASQAQIVKPYIEEAKTRLLESQERLTKAQDLVMKADKSGSAMSAAYLSTRDEISFLLDEIAILKNVIAANENRATRLVSPIYASDVPIAPKNRNVFFWGLFGGLFLGILFALGRQIIPKMKV